jgi:hypothetical protein
VGVVTDQASLILDDGVKVTRLGRIVVTLGAKLGADLDQKGAVLRGVGIVAVHAPTVGRGLMHNSCLGRIIMTPDAQIGRCLGEKGTVGRTVRIVAAATALILDDGMQVTRIRGVVVTFEAETFCRSRQEGRVV